VVLAYGEPDKNGFLYVERNGRQGIIPSDCLRDLSPAKLASSSTDRQSSRHTSGPASQEPDDSTLAHDKKVTKSHKHRTRDEQTIGKKAETTRAEQMTVDSRHPIRQHDQQMYAASNNSESSIHRHHRQH